MAKNYYDILGVNKSSSSDEIKRAYRKLASEHHPDRGGTADRFKEINEAYQVLSDSAKRGQYDQYGQTFDQAQRNGGGGPGAGGPFGGFDFSQGFGNGAGGFEFDFGDIFTDIFGGGRERTDRRSRGIDLEMPIRISFKEAAFGVDKEVTLDKQNTCQRCEGTGAEKGSKVVTCPKCHGQGSIKTSRRTILGTMQSQTTCDRCEGSGKIPEVPCPECKGSGIKRGQKNIKIKVPAGINNGQRIRLTGEGEAGYRGSTSGDLYILVEVEPSQEFKRQGFDLYKEATIAFPEAALGTTLETPTLDANVKIKIPSGTQSGKVFKVGGQGVPHLNRSGRGDMYVTVHVKTPEKLTKRQKELLTQFQEEEGRK